MPSVFVGTYTRKEPHVDGKGEGIYSFNLAESNGKLTFAAVTENVGINPSFLCCSSCHSSKQQVVYAVNECDEPSIVEPQTKTGYLAAFAVESDLKLRELNRQETRGAFPCHVSLHSSERFVVASNYGGGSVILYSILDDGSLAQSSSFHAFTGGCGVNLTRQEAAHLHSAFWAGKTDYLLACDLGNDKVRHFRLDKAKRALEMNGTEFTQRPAGSGPRHLAFHPSIKLVFVIDELSSSLGAHTFDPLTGKMSEKPLSQVSTLPKDCASAVKASNLGADVKVSSCGNFVFASNRGHDSIACFRINEGLLELVGFESSRGEFPRAMCVYEDFLLVANQNSDSIVVFRIEDTGKLKFTGHSVECPTPVSIAIA